MDKAEYPNNLKRERLKAFMSRAGLALLTEELAAQDGMRYGRVTHRTVERLERGERLPLPRTAASLAKVLDVPPQDLFPLGPAS